ncbi:uncharacterized protein [Taeniopygia guttata]|uniref:uncharacterized protein n=1 Tax=Taeniopygia guttata TaxID=59729 RepID=UPI003BB98919
MCSVICFPHSTETGIAEGLGARRAGARDTSSRWAAKDGGSVRCPPAQGGGPGHTASVRAARPSPSGPASAGRGKQWQQSSASHPNGAAPQQAQLSSRMTQLFQALTCSRSADPKKMLAEDVTDLSKSLFILQHFLFSILRQESHRSGPHSPALEPQQTEAGAQQKVLPITPSENTFTKELINTTKCPL